MNRLVEGTTFPAILLDIHGQGVSAETIYRGTGGGKTVKRLLRASGIEGLNGEHSILGYLERQFNYEVVPPHSVSNPEEEDQRFSGGYTVRVSTTHHNTTQHSKPSQHHGSMTDGEEHINAIQFELGKHLRCAQRDLFSSRLAEATIHHIHHYSCRSQNNQQK